MNQFAPCRFSHRLAAMLILGGMFTLALGSPVGAHQDKHLLIILDSSSSMEDQLAGELKYKLVRRAISHALSSYEGKLEAGLLAFGATHRSSCTDVSQIVPMRTLRPAIFSQQIDELRPKGKSPISAALSAAATLAKAASHPPHMLLIADGSDNCRANICATARNIARDLPKTRIHVIGLGTTKAVKKLACIAKATHGVFTSVVRADDMANALERLLRSVGTKKRLVARRPVTQTLSMLSWPPLPRRRPPNRLAKYQQPLSTPQHTSTITTEKKRQQRVEIPILIERSDPLRKQNLAQNSAAGPGASPAPLPYPIAQQKPKPGAAPATPFVGTSPNIEITLPVTLAPVKLGALITEQGHPIKSGLVWRIYNSAKGKDGRYKLVKSLKSPRFEGTLPLGVYLVNLSWGRSHLTEKMDILSSKPFAHNFILNAGGLRLAAKHMDGSVLPAREVVYQIYSDERDQFGKRRLILDNARPDRTIRLNAGIYHVKSIYGTANGIIESDITVEAGKLTDAVINHRASKVTFKLVIQPGGEALAGAHWRISTPDGQLIKETGGALPTLILAAGDYTINAKYSGRSFARKVTIEPGDPVHVEIVIQ